MNPKRSRTRVQYANVALLPYPGKSVLQYTISRAWASLKACHHCPAGAELPTAWVDQSRKVAEAKRQTMATGDAVLITIKRQFAARAACDCGTKVQISYVDHHQAGTAVCSITRALLVKRCDILLFCSLVVFGLCVQTSVSLMRSRNTMTWVLLSSMRVFMTAWASV